MHGTWPRGNPVDYYSQGAGEMSCVHGNGGHGPGGGDGCGLESGGMWGPLPCSGLSGVHVHTQHIIREAYIHSPL